MTWARQPLSRILARLATSIGRSEGENAAGGLQLRKQHSHREKNLFAGSSFRSGMSITERTQYLCVDRIVAKPVMRETSLEKFVCC